MNLFDRMQGKPVLVTEERFVKGRDGYWRVCRVAFGKDHGEPLDTESADMYMGGFPTPEKWKQYAERLLAIYERPRIYEKGLILVED